MITLQITMLEAGRIESALESEIELFEGFIKNNEKYRAEADKVTNGLHYANVRDHWAKERARCIELLERVKVAMP